MVLLVILVDAGTWDGWMAASGRYYKFFSQAATFQQASNICSAQGAYLAVIDDDLSNYVVNSLRGSYQVWIGYSQSSQQADFKSSEPTPFFCPDSTYTNWYIGEPNNHLGEYCVMMIAHGFWKDFDCLTKRAFVCSSPLGTAPSKYYFL